MKFYPDIDPKAWFDFPFRYDLYSVKRCQGWKKNQDSDASGSDSFNVTDKEYFTTDELRKG